MIPSNVAEGREIPSGVPAERWEAGKIGALRTPGGEVPPDKYRNSPLSKPAPEKNV